MSRRMLLGLLALAVAGAGEGSGGRCQFTWAGSAVQPPAWWGGELIAVTATGPDDAWAVGHERDTLTTAIPLREHWDGTSFTLVPGPAGAVVLEGVSASAPDDVWAVGMDQATDL